MDETLDLVIKLLVPALGGLAAALLAHASAWLRAKTRSLEAKAVIDLAEAVVADVQADVQHTVVERLKARGPDEHGIWDKSAAEDVKAVALKAIRRNLGPENMRRLNAALSGAAEQWLATRLEATVARSKRS